MERPSRGTQFARLRPTDLKVARALVEYPWLDERAVAAQAGISLNNLRTRAKFIYAVLGLENRLHLYAAYHAVLLGTLDGSPERGNPQGVPAAGSPLRAPTPEATASRSSRRGFDRRRGLK